MSLYKVSSNTDFICLKIARCIAKFLHLSHMEIGYLNVYIMGCQPDFRFRVNNLVVCQCNTLPVRLCISCIAWTIKVKEVDGKTLPECQHCCQFCEEVPSSAFHTFEGYPSFTTQFCSHVKILTFTGL